MTAACYKTSVASIEGTSSRTIVSPHLILLVLMMIAKLQVAEDVLGMALSVSNPCIISFTRYPPMHDSCKHRCPDTSQISVAHDFSPARYKGSLESDL